MYDSLRQFISFLEERKQLIRIKEPVRAELEITEITDRTTKAGGPALLFENVIQMNGEKARFPLLINMYGTWKRMAWSLGVEDVEEIAREIEGIIKTEPPSSFMDKLRMLPKLAKIGSYMPKSVSGKAACQEIVINDPDLSILPYLKCWPGDGGPFITLPIVITRDPETGIRNVGAYRMQVFGVGEDPALPRTPIESAGPSSLSTEGNLPPFAVRVPLTTTGMHWQIHKGGALHYQKYKALGKRMPVAVCLGGDPVHLYSATAPMPDNMDEMMLSGFIRKKAVELVKCKTIDLEVPADADFVLEGYVDPAEPLRREGPFGDHTGYYSLADDYPVFHVTTITHRKDPVYPTTIVGPPIQEDDFLGKASERIFLPLIKATFPEVRDMHLPFETCFHNLVIVSIKKQYPGHAKKIMHSFWGTGQLVFSKCIIVVDEDVNIQNLAEVAWRVSNNIDAKRDIIFAEGPVDALDHASDFFAYGSKLGIDATRKWKKEGFTREWPEVARMSPEVKKRIDDIWAKLGIHV